MGFVQREIDRIRAVLVAGDNHQQELYAAAQALQWALEPGGINSPFQMIMGIQEGSVGYHVSSNPALSECAYVAPQD